jgi:hypothetical protein
LASLSTSKIIPDDASKPQRFCNSIPSQSPCLQINIRIKDRVTTALIDSGESSCFIDRKYAEAIGVPFKQLPRSIPVRTIDGSALKDGDVTHCTVPVEIETCLGPEQICFYVITAPRQAIILGSPWLVKHNPDIDWNQRKLEPTKD